MTVMPAAAGFVGVTKWYEESRMAPGPVPWPFMLKMPGANGGRFTVCGGLVWPARVEGTGGGVAARSHGRSRSGTGGVDDATRVDGRRGLGPRASQAGHQARATGAQEEGDG